LGIEQSTPSATVVRKSPKLAAFQLTHPKHESTRCISVLVFVLSSFGLILDGDSCSRVSHV